MDAFADSVPGACGMTTIETESVAFGSSAPRLTVDEGRERPGRV